MRRLAEAKEAFVSAGDFAMAKYNLGYTYLLEDDLKRGLPLLEWRKPLLNLGSDLPKPEWDGGRRRGRRLLVIHEQGLGDTILMSRFYPRLLDTFDSVTVLVQKPLVRLIAAIDHRLCVTSSPTGADYDCWCATMSLPCLLGIESIDQIPTEPWLTVPAPQVAAERPRIGLNWAGNPSFAYDTIRSTSLENLKMFLQVEGVDWCSLHKGHREAEAEQFGLKQPLDNVRDFLDTALVLKGLDLVISTETAIPNLSAALGIPTCVLTTADRDWRWGSWYRGVTICDQDAPGNWFGSIAKALEVVRELSERTGSRV
jgi:hypothetical protein